MIESSALQWGAFLVGIAVLGYTAVLLRQELSKPEFRPQARYLIIGCMAFSLFGFGTATVIEIGKQDRLEAESKRRLAESVPARKLAEARQLVLALDARLGGDYTTAIRAAPASLKKTLEKHQDLLCRDLKDLKQVLLDTGETQCKASF